MVDDQKQGGEELRHETPKPKSALAAREEEVLGFWNKEGIFEKSLEKDAPKGDFIFYDGPPFANGLPHYGHILASTIKDAIPRYRTMQGYRVPRRWGWDCHGLPVENLVERELGLKSKRDIEQYGIEKFNQAARTSIMKDVSDWKRIIPRLGRWADMDHDYKTMDSTYTESVWWAFKNLYGRGLIYEGFKGLQYCPHCGTTLSNFEVAQGYKDIDDVAVYVKFPLVDEPETSLLIWTTTAWTLPGNTAAAIKADATYVKAKTDAGFLIVAKDLAEKVLGDAEVVAEMQGKELVGKKYLPPFDYYATELHKHKTHAWKVYAAPYVTLTDGTGIVHLAPGYGAEDLEFAQKEKIPLIQHVTEEGKFTSLVTDFAGLPVKPKGNPRETDEKVAALLRERGPLFKDEKITHSYPHCWRCDTPLLNWAANSWFVSVAKIKSKLSKENSGVHWVPGHMGTGRMGKGIESAPDWAISRSRYWGAPLPVWRNTKSKEIRVAGSVQDLLSMVRRSGNRYFAMRHAEAKSNVENVLDAAGDPENHLTDTGRNAALHAAADLKREKIDMIVTSPLVRTRETAAIVQKELGLPASALMVDERLREFDGGSLAEVRQRMGEFLFEIEWRYSNKNVLIISHGNPLWALSQVASRAPSAAFEAEKMLGLGEVRELPFVPFPHNADYELDLHRPYIDDVPMGNSVEGEWKRVVDVFDCWFESGSMPYASNHYPFRKETFNPAGWLGFGAKGYPADFIAEGVDQTRGWFYSLIVLGTALFGKSPYKNVIVNGLIVASDGQKMSKRLKNYPDPMEVVERYGADALRYYLLSSSVIRAEDLRFNERGVEEVQKKLLMRLDNVRSFYELYAPAEPLKTAPVPAHEGGDTSAHALDRWIFSRQNQLIAETTKGFENYELDAATRPLASFIDDLSTWYLRRSRDRFKSEGEDKQAALGALRYVLYTTARIMAPVMPFFAEDLYRRMRNESDPESVHLSSWPEAGAVDAQLLSDMQRVRELASRGLELRERAGIKVRQPLSRLSARSLPADASLRAIVADEVNVKEVAEDPAQKEEVHLETELTAELREEGRLRDFVRAVQDLRKKEGLTIADRPVLVAPEGEKEFIETWRAVIMDETGLKSIEIGGEALALKK